LEARRDLRGSYRRPRDKGSRIGGSIPIMLATFVDICIGATSVEVLKAQTKPPVYAVGEIDVRDPEGYAKVYGPLARAS